MRSCDQKQEDRNLERQENAAIGEDTPAAKPGTVSETSHQRANQ
jgi:hypothetical protein